jgi:hypothetical protein
MAFFQCGSVRLLVGLPEGEGALGSTVLWLSFFRDADRNLLAMMSEVRPAD